MSAGAVNAENALRRLRHLELLQLRAQRLQVEARGCDPDRLTAIENELDVLIASALEIREEQLLEDLNPKKAETVKPTRRRWWRRKES